MEITPKFEKGLRLTLLIVEGGTEISRDLLTYHVDALQNKQTLKEFLDNNRHTIGKLKLFTDQRVLLFPVGGDPDIKKWDITLLSSILINCCKLQVQMKKTVNDIRELRNKYHGHAPTLQISDDDFKNRWKLMTTAINEITKQINDTEITKKFNAMVHEYENGPLDKSVVDKALEKCRAESDVELLEHIIGQFLEHVDALDGVTLTSFCEQFMKAISTTALGEIISTHLYGKYLKANSTTDDKPLLIDTQYDVFVVHTEADNQLAVKVNDHLHKNKFKTYAYCKQGWKDVGRPIFDSIADIVSRSQRVLVLLTQNALKSHWVALETILAIEKSEADRCMLIRFAVSGLSEEQTAKIMKDVPYINLDNSIWKNDILTELKESYERKDAFPSFYLAHGLVFNYFVGYLRHVLPGLKGKIESHNKFKIDEMSRRLYILLSESCQVAEIKGDFGEYVIEETESNLEVLSDHGDKTRSYRPIMYSIKQKDREKKYYFVGECPEIVGTIAKLSKFELVPSVDLRLQAIRFRQTLEDLVNHRNNEVCNETVMFVDYNDKTTSHAEKIWNSLQSELSELTAGEDTGNVELANKVLLTGKCLMTVTHKCSGSDELVAKEVVEFLLANNKNITLSSNTEPVEQNVLDDARWKIFVMSKDSFRDSALIKQYNDAETKSIQANIVQVIPILARGTTLTDIPKKYRWIIMLMADDQNYLETLWNTVEGMKDRPKCQEQTPQGINIKMSETIPPLRVYEGLAWAYALNYLSVALLGTTEDGKGLKERFQAAVKKYNAGCKCIPRVFVIVPKTCETPTTPFEGEKHLGDLEPVVVGKRKYFLKLYRLTLKTGEKVCYAREYATPAIALYEMAHHHFPFAGLDKEEMYKQSGHFADHVKAIIHEASFIKIYGDLEDKCSIVRFDDQLKGMTMTKALEEKLGGLLYNKKYIQPYLKRKRALSV